MSKGIIAQDEVTNIARLNDIQAAVGAILAPYATTTVGYQFFSVEEDALGTNTIGWYEARGTLASEPEPAPPPIAEDLNAGEDSVIAVTITYTHSPIIFKPENLDWLFPTITFDKTVYARPRRVPVIPCEDCP